MFKVRISFRLTDQGTDKKLTYIRILYWLMLLILLVKLGLGHVWHGRMQVHSSCIRLRSNGRE